MAQLSSGGASLRTMAESRARAGFSCIVAFLGDDSLLPLARSLNGLSVAVRAVHGGPIHRPPDSQLLTTPAILKQVENRMRQRAEARAGENPAMAERLLHDEL